MAIDSEKIKDSVSLADLFKRDGHVLKRVGGRLRCLCPFHEEKSPSCIVNDDRGTFKCFGCSAGGDHFTYWALSRGLNLSADFHTIAKQLSDYMAGDRNYEAVHRIERVKKEAELPAPLSGNELSQWQEGLSYLAAHPKEQEAIANWRGYRVETVSDLVGAGKIGLVLYYGNRLPAFAVEAVKEGVPYLAGFHVRLKPRPGEKRAMWHFCPQGIGSWPFVIGDMANASAIFWLEGQWDAIALLDAMDFGAKEDRCAIVGIRGNTSWRKSLAYQWNQAVAQSFMFCDNDEAGMNWVTDGEDYCFATHLRVRSKALHAFTIEGVKDFNDANKFIQDTRCEIETTSEIRREWWKNFLREVLRRYFMAGLKKRKTRIKKLKS